MEDAPRRPQAAHHRRAHRPLDRLRGRAARAQRRAPRSSSPASAAACGSPSASPSAACPGRPTCSSSTSTTRPQLEALATALDERWGRVDGVLHAIAFVPADALGGRFLQTPSASAVAAFETERVLAQGAQRPRCCRCSSAATRRSASSASTSTRSVAWPAYDWAGVSKAALESINRYLARDLGPRGVRSNLVAAGPLQTVAASNIDGFDVLAQIWERQAPLGWDLVGPSIRWPTPASSCSRRSRARSPARSCTSTAACTRSGRRRRPPSRPRSSSLADLARWPSGHRTVGMTANDRSGLGSGATTPRRRYDAEATDAAASAGCE